ncbi:MAG: hypothetical protein PUF61_11425 [Spirochaetales bacterium]|nr:hypothetical protein [Spirochaetales bacterium]
MNLIAKKNCPFTSGGSFFMRQACAWLVAAAICLKNISKINAKKTVFCYFLLDTFLIKGYIFSHISNDA